MKPRPLVRLRSPFPRIIPSVVEGLGRGDFTSEFKWAPDFGGIEEMGGAAATEDQFHEAVVVAGGSGGEGKLAFGNGEHPAYDEGGSCRAVDGDLYLCSRLQLCPALSDGGFEVPVAVNPGDLVLGDVGNRGGIDGVSGDGLPFEMLGDNFRVEVARAELGTAVFDVHNPEFFQVR